MKIKTLIISAYALLISAGLVMANEEKAEAEHHDAAAECPECHAKHKEGDKECHAKHAKEGHDEHAEKAEHK